MRQTTTIGTTALLKRSHTRPSGNVYYVEGERDLLLETDRDDEIFVAWRKVRTTFWAWVHRLQAIASEMEQEQTRTKQAVGRDLEKDPELPRLDQELHAAIHEFAVLCRRRIRALR